MHSEEVRRVGIVGANLSQVAPRTGRRRATIGQLRKGRQYDPGIAEAADRPLIGGRVGHLPRESHAPHRADHHLPIMAVQPETSRSPHTGWDGPLNILLKTTGFGRGRHSRLGTQGSTRAHGSRILGLTMFRAEFSIYPFLGGEAPPDYVQAAIDAVRAAGIDVDIGLLGESVTGELDTVLEAIRVAVTVAAGAGATKVVFSIESIDRP